MLNQVGYRLPIVQKETVTAKVRSEVLRRIQEEWKDNCRERKNCTLKLEIDTKCRAERERSGFYKYIDLESFNEVDAYE